VRRRFQDIERLKSPAVQDEIDVRITRDGYGRSPAGGHGAIRSTPIVSVSVQTRCSGGGGGGSGGKARVIRPRPQIESGPVSAADTNPLLRTVRGIRGVRFVQTKPPREVLSAICRSY